MQSEDQIRNNLINKILAIRNKEFLMALDQLITSGSTEAGNTDLTPEQELVLQMSEDDIQNRRILSREEMKEKATEWL
ncbi:MAG: hypothetical protein BRD50_07770 [Bacteroidetes bacterium SW_11_45_7]|nr:MAG: hypothetical protein BRD50_07770 [Bacteroidetes bacterium SW_11_45_7]